MNLKANLPVSAASPAGKKISFHPRVGPQEKILRSAARQGFYYAALALKQLTSLSAGPLGKHNVFIPNINDSRAHTLQVFYMYVPGIKATVERRSNDSYIVTELELSDGYAQIGRTQDKPGIYAVSKNEIGFSAKYKKNGRIAAEDKRVVVICDGGYPKAEEAAKDAAKRLKDTAGAHEAVAADFDIMYPALEKTLGGMRNYDPLAITTSQAAAGILAKAMIDAKSKKQVRWISEFGGSTVFTQAMQIVAQQNITLNGHIPYMYKPRTNPAQAVRLAHKIGFQIGKDFAKAGGIRASVSALTTNALRARNKKDDYSWNDYAKDMATGGMLGVGLAGAGILVASLPGTVGTLSIAGAVTSGIGATHLLWTTSKNLLEKPKTK